MPRRRALTTLVPSKSRGGAAARRDSQISRDERMNLAGAQGSQRKDEGWTNFSIARCAAAPLRETPAEFKHAPSEKLRGLVEIPSPAWGGGFGRGQQANALSRSGRK